MPEAFQTKKEAIAPEQQKKPTPALPETKKTPLPPHHFFEVATAENTARDRVFVDPKRGAFVLVAGGEGIDPTDTDLAATVARSRFNERLKSGRVDEQPVAADSHGEMIFVRENAAVAATFGPFADFEAGIMSMTQAFGSETRRVPEAVIGKVIRREIVPIAMAESEPLPSEQATIKEFVELLRGVEAANPEETALARRAVYEGLRYDQNFQDLSDAAKLFLHDELVALKLAPRDEAAARRLLEREKLVATTSAGADVAIIVVRGAHDRVENITAGLKKNLERTSMLESGGRTVTVSASRPQEVSAELNPGDIVVMVPSSDSQKLIDAIRVARGAAPEVMSQRLREAGFETNLILEAK